MPSAAKASAIITRSGGVSETLRASMASKRSGGSASIMQRTARLTAPLVSSRLSAASRLVHRL